MLDFPHKKLILTVEVGFMALPEFTRDLSAFFTLPTAEDFTIPAPQRDVPPSIFKDARGEAVLIEKVSREDQEAMTASVEKVIEIRAPVYSGEMPDAINRLFEETGVFAAVGKEERNYQKMHERIASKGNIIDISTRRPIEHSVYPAPKLAAVAGGK